MVTSGITRDEAVHRSARVGRAMSAGPCGLSVVVPVYNSCASLNELTRRLVAVLADLTPDFEIILVNDGSADTSWSVIRELAATYSYVRGDALKRKYGPRD